MTSMALAFDVLARDRASKTFTNVGNAAEGTGRKVKGFHAAAVAGAAVAGAAIVKFGKDSVHAFMDAQQSQAQLDLAMKKFPKTADVSRDSFNKLNEAIQRKTGFDDDQLASSQAVLAQFNLTGKQIQSLTPLVADLASKTGQDLPDAGRTLGKAFLGNTKALKQLGISYKSTGNLAKDQANIQALLQAKIGGTAEAMGNTAAGKAKILGTEYENLQEKVGSKLVPILLKLADVGLKVVDFISRNSSVIGPLVAIVGTLIVGIKAWTIAQAALNVVMDMNPIGLVIIAVAALVAGLVVAYKKSETFRKIVDGAFRAVGKAFDFVKDHWKLFLAVLFPALAPIILMVQQIVQHFGTLKTIVTGAFSAVGDAAKGMWNNVLRPTFRFMADAWFTVVGALVNGAAKAFGWVPGIGPKLKAAAKSFNNFRDEVNSALDGIHKTVKVSVIAGYSAPQDLSVAHHYAAGTSYASRGWALVGEQGPEIRWMSGGERITNNRDLRQALAGPSGSGGFTVQGNLVVNEAGKGYADSLPRTLSETAYLLGRG